MSRTYDHGGNIFAVARTLGVPASEIIDFSASINPLGISQAVKDAITESINSLTHYPDSRNHQLKQALAAHHGIMTENLALANGSTELIYNLPLLFSGKSALIVSPTFSEYEHALEQHCCRTTHFILSPENEFALDTVALKAALKQGYSALYLCNPGNPSGRLYPLQTIQEVANICREAGTFLVLDEAFMDFCEADSAKLMIVENSDSVILRSMTKFYGFPGLRLGYAIGNPSVVERLEAMGGPWSVNALALDAGLAALGDRQHIEATIACVTQERQWLMEEIFSIPGLKPYSSAANYILVEIKKGPVAAELQKRLLTNGVLIRDCANFQGLSPRFFRIAVRKREENLKLTALLEQVLK
jgi:threonine-phosphate decarboxylase